MLTHLSLFSGAGGMDVGLEAAGFHLLRALELESFARETLTTNRPSWNVPDEGDVIEAADKLRPHHLGLAPGELDLISGGPPCQPFSSAAQWAANGRRGMTDLRANTVHALLDLIEHFRPKAVLLENVQGFVSGRNAALGAIKGRLAVIEANYGVSYSIFWRLMNAADYGVPQNRRRVIIVIIREEYSFSWPEPTHEGNPATAWDAFWDLPASTDQTLMNGKWEALLPAIPPGKNYLWFTSEGGGQELFGYRTRYWNFLLKLAPTLPSWTLAASPGPSTGPFHWSNRPLTAREMLRLQSFPDDWVITGDRRLQTKQIGNATPPLLAEVVGASLARTLLGLSPTDHTFKPKLAIDRAASPPPAVHALPLPPEFHSLIGAKQRHAGPGRGPAPINALPRS